MLTRLKVRGFKNLVDLDVRFGPFTCIAGANGVGKSNLFDAIQFLSALASDTLLEATKSVRDSRRPDVLSLFYHAGDSYAETIFFEVEMVVPAEGEDDLGQKAQASMTFLRYTLELGYREDDGNLEIHQESLVHINKGDAVKHLLFPHSVAWRNSVIQGRRTEPLISTVVNSVGETAIRLHQDGGGKGGGRPSPRIARTLPRTLLHLANAAEYRTAVLARNEMRSWALFQLEPTALREADDLKTPGYLTTKGGHLPATLYRLARRSEDQQVYDTVALRMSELVQEIREIGVERDDKRDLLTLWAASSDGTRHSAHALSDGTLRFLALATLEIDPDFQGVLCLEEPENGIHPERIGTMLNLLQALAVDTSRPVDEDNPLRQVIINTHSPLVVLYTPGESLLAAEVVHVADRTRGLQLSLSCLPETWRTRGSKGGNLISKSKLLRYLRPEVSEDLAPNTVGQLAWVVDAR
ncbi:AAA family ATPase [Armatimonas sp.]|uniref:AAA family ATPase n=1 Tax=Armatimonas sp. TaxID=1872638 RepID=UPI0037515CE0